MEEKHTVPKGKFRLFWENYWYHYKWPTLIALFVIFVVTVCMLQMLENKGEDAYVLYGGNKSISPEMRVKLETSLEEIVEDIDGNGTVHVAIEHYTVFSNDEVLAQGEQNMYLPATNETNHQNFIHATSVSSATIYLLSPMLYEEIAEKGGLLPIADHVPDGIAVEYYGEYGILLSSLPFYQKEGVRELPADTVLCIRDIGVFASIRNPKAAKEAHEKNLEALYRLFLYGTSVSEN